jgi:hypothetical protein
MGGSTRPESSGARRSALGALVLGVRPLSHTVDRQDRRGEIRQEARMPCQRELGSSKSGFPPEPVMFASDMRQNSLRGGWF